MEFEGRKRINMHLDIAPLIDIVFLLLIFFMLTANFIMQPGIKITLPAAKSSLPQEEDNIIISITKDNRIFLNESEKNLDELEFALQKKLEESEGKTVILKADEKINLGLAIKVMDIAKYVGSEKLVISTKTADNAEVSGQLGSAEKPGSPN